MFLLGCNRNYVLHFLTQPIVALLYLSNFAVRPGQTFLKTLDMDEEKGKMLSSEKHYPKKAFPVS